MALSPGDVQCWPWWLEAPQPLRMVAARAWSLRHFHKFPPRTVTSQQPIHDFKLHSLGFQKTVVCFPCYYLFHSLLFTMLMSRLSCVSVLSPHLLNLNLTLVMKNRSFFADIANIKKLLFFS